MKYPPIFAFTDCRDENTITRLNVRLTALFENSLIHSVGVEKDIEAAGCILDALDAFRLSDRKAIFIGNLAPRTEKHHKNGAPFYYGKVGKCIVVATKTCFALLFKLGLVTEIYETDVETVCRKFLPEAEALRIANSQFRSFEYIPLLSLWLSKGKTIPSTPTQLDADLEVKDKVWWVDNFGNIKTTITEKELKDKIVNGKVSFTINETTHTFPFFQRLADVPKHEHAVMIGSSGYKDTRFAEITIQGKSAAKEFGIKAGDLIS